ncbi:MAG: hypothetical protein E7546_03640 [Ruminococcaceae bacterium]|nr:hypothetical protein [Oscillospiraceae bacterium]
MPKADLLTQARGFCEFRADGVFPERFLNLCSGAGMGLWQIERTKTGIKAHIIASRYKKLRPLAKKCSLRLHVEKKHGLPFTLIPYRKRSGFVLGLFLFCGIIWLMSQFVWFIQLPEVSPELRPQLEQALEDSGVRAGALTSRVDGSLIATKLELELPGIMWITVNTYGSSVTVDLREIQTLNPVVGNDEPCNVVAAKPGIIISADAMGGEAQVSAGQTVAAGDLLISGIVEYQNGSVSMLHAWGDVWARTDYEFSCTVPYLYTSVERSGKVTTNRRLFLLGFEIPLGYTKYEGECELEVSKQTLNVLGVELPFSLITENRYETVNLMRMISEDEALAIARQDISAQLESCSGIEILSRVENVKTDETGITVTLKITAKENIAKQELILFGDNS